MGKRKERDEPLPASIEIAAAPINRSDANLAIYFPSGFDPNSKEGMDCEWETFAAGERKKQYAIVTRTGKNVDFVGSTSGGEYTSALPCRYAFGVYDKKTGELIVNPIPSGRIIRMEPRARSLNYSAASPGASDTQEAALAEQRRAQNMRLVEEFGSQRRRRQLNAQKAAQVDAGQVTAGGAILEMIASQNVAAETKEEVIARSLAVRNIPPHHPGATTAEDAYRLREVIPASIWDALEIRRLFPAEDKPEYRQMLVSAKTFGTRYVMHRVTSVLSSAHDTTQREARARCLVLVGHLLKLHTHRGPVLRADGGIAELAKKCQMESSVLEGVLDLFYNREGSFEGDKFMLSKEKKDLMLGYILILAVLAEPECSLDPDGYVELSLELKMRPADLVQRFRELGCVDVPVTSISDEGGKTRSYKVTLMPKSGDEGKTLKDCFPGLKLGGRKPGGR